MTALPPRVPRAPHAWPLVLALAALAAAPLPALASQALASDKGCYNCHGNPPRKSAPTFAQLASELAKARGNSRALQKAADRLRSGSILSHIAAHERLSAEEALALVRWISEGARAP